MAVIYQIKLFLLLVSFIFLVGCMQSKVIERHAIINSYGIDVAKNGEGQIDSTIIAFLFNNQSNLTETITGTGSTVRDARQDAETKAIYNFLPGQIRLILYGKEVAENGITPYLNTLVRDARTSDMMYSAISTKTAKEVLLTKQEVTGINVGQYIQELIEKEITEDSIPDPSLHKLTHTYEDTGKDPFLPLIGLTGDKPALKGMALLQDGKYVGELPLSDGFLVNLFQKRIRDKPFHLTIPRDPLVKYINNPQEEKENFDIDLLVIDGKSKTKITDVNQLHFETDVKLKVNLYETSESFKIESEKVSKILEKEVEKEIKRQYEELLINLQEANSDPLGLGNIFRSNTTDGQLTSKEWRKKFPETTVDFNVNVDLINYGSIQ
ncbi:Ger(x)C family spore germination protein [Virgibacillus salexigens]|uniref:Ger(x)C family spore germination protein n=1 Tax=Virgibacillus salexigens TaxID=61016 RepID=UPI00190BC55F|nr:Ger(x)C family spore germination protein [Virgibacillus salexigens]